MSCRAARCGEDEPHQPAYRFPWRFRCGIHRGRTANRAQRRPDAPEELDHGAVDRRM